MIGESMNITSKAVSLGNILSDKCWGDVDIVAGITKLEEQVAGNTKLKW